MSEYYRPESRDEALTQVKQQLGYPVVNIELAPENFLEAYSETVQWYVARKGRTKTVSIPMVSGVCDYALPADCDELVDVFFPPGRYDTFQNSLLDFGVELSGVPVDGFRDRSGLGTYSRIDQMLGQNEIAREIFSATYEWVYDTANRVLSVDGNIPSGIIALVKYKSMEFDIKKLTALELEAFMGYLKGSVKLIYGRVLRKHGEIPGASGPKTMDGADLVSEGKEERDYWSERISLLNGPSGFFAE